VSEPDFGRTQPDPAANPAAANPAAGQGAAYPGAARPDQPPVSYAPRPQVNSSSRGFIASLFDFGFNSFVTTTAVKVVYVLITILLVLVSLVFVVFAFLTGPVEGIVALFIGAPLFFFVYLSLCRISLEIFVVVFRIADDIRVIRDRGGLR
jgi:hypothetical protein